MTKTGWRGWLDGLTRNLSGKRRRRAAGFIPAGKGPYRTLELERLEDRVVPAFDLLVNATGATAGVTATVSGTTTTFTATATGAHLNVNDIVTALNTGNVVVDSGATGTEAGDITINAGVTQPGANGAALTFQSGSGTGVVGNINVNADFTSAGGGDHFPLNFLALNNLVLNGRLQPGSGDITLTATNGAISQTSGLVTNVTNLSLTAGTGIGSAATPLALGEITNVQALDGTGGVFLSSNDTNIGFGGATPGIQVTGSGDISVTANLLGVSNAVEGPGNITIQSELPAGFGGGVNLAATAPVTSTGGAGTSINLAGDSVTIASAVSDAGGAVSVLANGLTFTGTVSTGASSGVVTLAPFSSGRAIDLGHDPSLLPGELGLSQTDLDNVTTGVLRIGSSSAGSITVTAAITDVGTGWSTLSLITGSTVSEPGGSLTVTSLAVQAADDINLGPNNGVAVSNVAASSLTGGFDLFTTPSLTVTTVDGVSGISTGAVILVDSTVANTSLTVSQPVTTNGGQDITFIFDNMTLSAGVDAAGHRVTLEPFSSGQLIDVGTNAGLVGTLGLAQSDLANVTASTLQIGDSAAGFVTISNAITLTNATTLDLETGGSISETTSPNVGTVSVADLAVRAVGAVSLGQANAVTGAFAATGPSVLFVNGGDLTIGTADGLVGVTSTAGAIDVTASDAQ